MLAVTRGPDGPKLDYKYPVPTPGPGEALLRVTLAGICSTDVEVAFRKYKGDGWTGVLGHEFVGIIHAINVMNTRNCEFARGDRVVAEINVVSPTSRSKDYHERAQDSERSCLGIFGHDGVFAEYVSVPVVNLHKVPDNVPDEVAVFTEPLAAACQILEQVDIKPSSKVAVLGIGKLGILAAMTLKACGKDVVAISRKGTHFAFLEARNIPTMKLSEAEYTDYFDFVVECTGSAEGFNTSIGMVKPYGTIVLKTTRTGTTTANLTAVVVKEVTLVGSRCGPFQAALRLLSSGQVVVDDLNPEFYDLAAFPKAISRSLQEDALKVVLRMGKR